MKTKIQNLFWPKKNFTWLWRSLDRSFATYTSLLWEIFCVDIKRQIWIQRGKNGCKILSSLGIPQVWIIPLPTSVCLPTAYWPQAASQSESDKHNKYHRTTHLFVFQMILKLIQIIIHFNELLIWDFELEFLFHLSVLELVLSPEVQIKLQQISHK